MIPKFREWDAEREKLFEGQGMSYGVKRDFDNGFMIEFAHMEDLNTINKNSSIDRIVMMSTDLKDISGTVIYEGDIVHVNYKLSIVKYKKGSFYIEFIDFPKIIMLSDFYFKSYTNDLILKVQGNIYENPELLEG